MKCLGKYQLRMSVCVRIGVKRNFIKGGWLARYSGTSLYLSLVPPLLCVCVWRGKKLCWSGGDVVCERHERTAVAVSPLQSFFRASSEKQSQRRDILSTSIPYRIYFLAFLIRQCCKLSIS